MCPTLARRHLLLPALLLAGALLLNLPALPSARAFSNGQAADLVLGQPNFTAGAVNAVRLSFPQGSAVDPTTGAVFVSDSNQHRVLRFASVASLSSGAGAEAVLGQPTFNTRAETTTAEGMAYPGGVAVDGSGTLWVADTSNHRVLRFDNAASKPSGAAADGVLGQASFTSRFPSTSLHWMSGPSGVAVDSSGRLWVADTNNSRVLRFDNPAGKPNGAAADGVLGQPSSTSFPRLTNAQDLNMPSGVAVDGSGWLWVADTGNNRVLRFDSAASKPNGGSADGVLGQIDFSSNTKTTSAQGMASPCGVAVDASGRLWVTDTDNNRVLWFDAAANKPDGPAADGVLGNTGFTTTRPISGSLIEEPASVVVDPTTGKLFVADLFNNRVLRFAARAALTNGAAAEAVLGQPAMASLARATTAQGMSSPTGMAIDQSGRLWVADSANNRVLRFDAAAGKPDGAAADGVLGQTNFTSGAKATSAQGMNYPIGLAADGSGRLWVADTFNSRVLRFDDAAGKPNGAAADAVLGQPGFTSYIPATSAQGMGGPTRLAAGGGGQLWVADSDNNRVLRFDAAAGKPNGAAADAVLGQPGFTSRTTAVSAQGMNYPAGVALDGSGGLWVADYYNNRVLFFGDTPAPSSTPTQTLTETATATPTGTTTAAPTATGTPTETSTVTLTATGTSTPTPTPTSTGTATGTPTPISTGTTTGTPTPTGTGTATGTSAPTGTATTPTDTPTATSPATSTATGTPTPTGTSAPASTPTSAATVTPTDTVPVLRPQLYLPFTRKSP